eukprot:TRINITY_DN2468_c0_g1_i1.p1 TRINITY_DN2468_c0_g1~~TRINITY_DN2468_c0_g1_i1.p1  ORF type:complete len:305 (+),score=106.58 TRINITY_DN2468_c0_g1_i1:57-917(+)
MSDQDEGQSSQEEQSVPDSPEEESLPEAPQDEESEGNDSECNEGENIFFSTKWVQKEPNGVIQYSDIADNDVWLIRVPCGFNYSSLQSITLTKADQNQCIGTHIDTQTNKKYQIKEAPPIEALSKVSIFPQNGKKFYWGKPFSRQLDILQDVVIDAPTVTVESNTEKKKEPKLNYKFIPAGAVLTKPTPIPNESGPVGQPIPEQKKVKKSKSKKSKSTKVTEVVPTTQTPSTSVEPSTGPTPSEKKSKEKTPVPEKQPLPESTSKKTKKRKKSQSETNLPAKKSKQ